MREILWSCALMVLSGAAQTASAPTVRGVLALPADPQRGATVFEQCVACHRPDGGGATDGSVPRIGGQHRAVIVKQMLDYGRSDRWDLRMEAVVKRHALASPQQIADVAAHLSNLPGDMPRGMGTGEWLSRGSVVYERACSGCHGPAGEGDAERVIPRLAGQHYGYLLRQLYDTVDGRRPNMSEHVSIVAGLNRDELQGVADYLSRISANE